jgi:catechol 2,3-dioxygenase-like lactoylglutathione lyase family enzyme
VPAKGVIHHVDLAVSDVERSLAFYLNLLGPLGWKVTRRYPTYRGTEEVIYIGTGEAYAVVGNAGPDAGALGLRPADGGAHQYYGVGVEHIAFEVDARAEVEEDRDEPGYYAFFAFDPDGIRVEVFSWTSVQG